jgi:hypothetical protein
MSWYYITIYACIRYLVIFPETIRYVVTRRKRLEEKKRKEKTAQFWRIRNLEMDIYGRWLDLDHNKELMVPIEEERDEIKYD